MKKVFLAAMFLLISAAWVMAQDSSAPLGVPQSGQQPGAMGATGSQAPGQQTGQAPGQQTPGQQPDNPAGAPDMGTQAQAGQKVVEGCLGGKNPDYTVKDDSGKTYKLLIPPGADASVLSQHIGESVKVTGTVGAGEVGAASAGADASGDAIAVSKISRGTSKCPAGAQSQAPQGK
jgi:hypothetical protein